MKKIQTYLNEQESQMISELITIFPNMTTYSILKKALRRLHKEVMNEVKNKQTVQPIVSESKLSFDLIKSEAESDMLSSIENEVIRSQPTPLPDVKVDSWSDIMKNKLSKLQIHGVSTLEKCP